MPNEERRTFNLPWSGLTCEKCNTPLPNIWRTRRFPGMVYRERRCPKCGHCNKTSERVIESQR